ncbi:MAG: BamA/TamA family outer membrane protein [Bacteroidales bacterium]|nr:BamA/TamA family outer membrane protein [Bacteroidales bacterium]
MLDGDLLLQESGVEFENSDPYLSRSDFVNLQKQQPNNRLLGIPLRLKIYSFANIDKQNRWSKFLQRAGEPPVIFDSAYALQTTQDMRQYLVNKGHFEGTVSYSCDTLKKRTKKIKVTYHIHTGEGYHYRNVSLVVNDDSLANHFNVWPSRTLIKSGQPYDVEVLRTEQSRIQRRLQERGYYAFDRNAIEFVMDSSLNAHLMDITMIVNPPKLNAHSEIYRYGDVYIFPDEKPGQTEGLTFDTTAYRVSASRADTTTQNYYFVHSQPLRIRPSIVASKLLIRPGELYSLRSVDQTYENLLNLQVYRTTNITMQPKPIDSNNPHYLLNTLIDLKQSPTKTWGVDFEVSTASQGLQGAAINGTYQNKNLFGGAEIFSLRLRGLVELQYLLNRDIRREGGFDLVDNIDVKLDASIDFPRFIAPLSLRRTAQFQPRTLLNLGGSLQHRPQYYNRAIANASLSYTWRQPRLSHSFFPIDLSLVNINLNPVYQETINRLSQNNQRLQYQYSDHFIFAARYGFSFSGQQNRPTSFNAFRFSLETSGNLLSLISQAINAQKNADNFYTFFNLAYSQYFRTELELKRYWNFENNHILVTRLMAGGGFVYGNSTVLPYEKGFFAGGTNNIRAWPMNQLGPGSSSDSLMVERVGDIVGVGNIEYRFPIYNTIKGAVFMDIGNIWLYKDNESFPGGQFAWNDVFNDLAVGGGAGLRWDLGFFIIRLDAALPLRDPAKPAGEKWVIKNAPHIRDFVLNFGIGYPF